PASFSELASNGLFGFILGAKALLIISDSSAFLQDPPGILLSLKGSWTGGIAGGLLFAYLKYREKKRVQLPAPKTIQETVYPHQQVTELTMMAALGGLVGAKLFHILEYWHAFLQDPLDMIFSGSGLTMYGGLIVGAIAVLYYGRKQGIPPLELCDATAPGLMLAYGTGRIGCQLAGDGDWGIVNHAPKPDWLSFIPDWAWSSTYPHNVLKEGVPIPGCTGRHCFELPEPVFPTPLYESILCIGFFFLLWAFRKRLRLPGQVFGWYLILNGLERFAIESIRVNSLYHVAGISFTQAQLISVLLFISGLTLLTLIRRDRPKQHA
ncbi:MAG: prolipoprotein diacylglyceryl transferase, partial [Bacteroidia bacterium]|nr:prolipoprotein diacylglyceryl transferase [Bacteroidia bacterium]